MSQQVHLNPTERLAFKQMLVDITNSLAMIDAQREHIKDVAEAAEEKYGIKKKVVNKLAKTMYSHTYSSLQAENEHFSELYELVVEGKKGSAAPAADDEE